jgi:hypothetical protein
MTLISHMQWKKKLSRRYASVVYVIFVLYERQLLLQTFCNLTAILSEQILKWCRDEVMRDVTSMTIILL